MRKAMLFGAAALLAAVPASAADQVASASGQGQLNDGRTFSFSARIYADGTADGQATLINTAFSGDSGRGPYRARFDILCALRVDDNTVIFGGTTTRTNDSNLVDAAFFSVRDDGEPGGGRDQISRAYFWDDVPATTGDPMTCLNSTLADIALETIESGNIQVKSAADTALQFRSVPQP